MSASYPLILLPLAVATSCVGYTEDPVSVARIADEVADRPGGAFSLEQAMQTGLRWHPDLRVLEARARAAAAERSVPFVAVGEARGRNESVGLMLDPIALLGLGPRGGQIDVADARHAEAVQELAVERWRTVAKIAETWLVDEALRGLRTPDVAVDVQDFEGAGLASPVAAAKLRAAQAKAQRERLELQRARSDNLAQLRHLLGLGRYAAVEIRPSPADWLQQPEGTGSDLLTRPDLALAVARFETRDARFRAAVADQYPSVQLGPNISLRGDPLRAMGMLRLPFGMHGRAEAARELRQAARIQLEETLLRAYREAELADRELAAARADERAARAAIAASSTKLAAARTALEVQPDAFEPFAAAAGEFVRASRELREAVLRLQRARIARAKAFAWPRSSEGQAP